MSVIGTIVSDFKKAGEEVKAFLMKIGDEAPAIVATVTKDEQAVVQLVEAFLPGSKKAIDVGNAIFDLAAQAVEDAGAAAGANGLSITLDQATVADIQSIIAAAKAAAAKKTVPVSS